MALVAKALGVSQHEAIDVARLGSILARGYDCRWRTIDATITPENRILVGLARPSPAAALARLRVQRTAEAKYNVMYSSGEFGPASSSR